MKVFAALVVSVALGSATALACMTAGHGGLSRDRIKSVFRSSSRAPAASTIEKFAAGHPTPSLESKLGNLLLEHGEKSGRIVLSIPAGIAKSGYHPFGDGQSNAKMNLGSWTADGFPVVGVQAADPSGGAGSRKYVFHPSLKVQKYKESDLGSGWFKVQPDGWEDSFYFSFTPEIMSVSEMTKGIPADLRTFAGNRTAPDPAKIGRGTGSDRIVNKDLGAGYNKQAWYDTNVHGVFPNKEGARTALGGVLTWGIVDKAFGPFKHLYTCFEARDSAKEKELGVPSGAGWHHIGDAAETLLNSLDKASLPVAVGRSHGKEKAAYGLTESIVATWLKSDEVFVTRKGEFHWYLNPHPSSVCTEIWVHGCVPDLGNNWGFRCQQ